MRRRSEASLAASVQRPGLPSPPSLRRRVFTVLVQWFLLLAVVSVVVVGLSFAGVRKGVVDERLLLARAIAHSLDVTVATSLQELGRLGAGLQLQGDVVSQLRAFRFHSPFREATYLIDERGRLIASDPPDVQPLPADHLPRHELVTSLIRKTPDDPRPVVALVQPLRRERATYYLVSEMSPVGSTVAAVLQDVGTDPETHVVVVDEDGVVIAGADVAQLFRILPHAADYGERIRAHRPFVSEDQTCEFVSDRHPAAEVVTVMAPLRFARWGVLIEQHKTKAFAGLYTTRRGLLLAGALLAAMGVVLTRAISRSVVSPILQLSRQAEAMRAGDLSRPVTVSGDREIEVLAQTLDEARQRLASTLDELTRLNADLESQVAARTRLIEARYQDLALLHAVAQLPTEERELDRIVPGVLRLVAEHYRFPAVALVTRPPDRSPTMHVVPPGTPIPWVTGSPAPPADWQRRDIVHQGRLQAELFHPRQAGLDEQVMEALCHQLALSLHGAYLWQHTLEQDEHRQVLVRRLLSATEEERRRIARELHDEISQLLTVIQLSLDRVEVDTPEMAKARTLLARTQRDVHRIIYDLRPSLLDDLGLAAALESHAQEHLVRHGLEVHLEIDDKIRAGPEVGITIFRIYQELVTNILRHAQAEHVSIELYERDGRLVLGVEDDGVGFDPGKKSDGVGLAGMRERAALVGGSVRFDSEQGMGTHVVVEIPIS